MLLLFDRESDISTILLRPERSVKLIPKYPAASIAMGGGGTVGYEQERQSFAKDII